jgi:hypothetical protein
LVKECYQCHSASSKTIKGQLLLDTRAGIRKGGESGAAIEPGGPVGSLLIEALRYEGLEMPPKGQLPEQTIADFAKWVKMAGPFTFSRCPVWREVW